MIYLIADTHFMHNNIIKYCNRPFKDAKEMDKKMIENWNNTVNEDDMVIHLGDFALGSIERMIEINKELNGEKVLLLGNHDNRTKSAYKERIGFKEVFNKEIIIQAYTGIQKGQVLELLLTHRPKPIEVVENRNFDYNIHGHTHDSPDFSDKHISVCVEKIDYTPRSIEISKPYRIGGK